MIATITLRDEERRQAMPSSLRGGRRKPSASLASALLPANDAMESAAPLTARSMPSIFVRWPRLPALVATIVIHAALVAGLVVGTRSHRDANTRIEPTLTVVSLAVYDKEVAVAPRNIPSPEYPLAQPEPVVATPLSTAPAMPVQRLTASSQATTLEIVQTGTESQNPVITTPKPPLVAERPSDIKERQGRYAGLLIRHLNKHRKYPRALRDSGIEGRGLVEFRLQPDGNVASLKLVRSTGSGTLDKLVVDIFKRAEPFPTPEWGRDLLQTSFTLPVDFTITT